MLLSETQSQHASSASFHSLFVLLLNILTNVQRVEGLLQMKCYTDAGTAYCHTHSCAAIKGS